MIKPSHLLVFLLLGAGKLYAQAPSQTLSAPSADQKFLPGVVSGNSSLGSIYSPNLFDGSANINIPLYDYSNDQGSFGISLSYNTKGITIDETSGPAGHHFNLVSSGTISRVLKDLPDDLGYNMGVNNPAQTISMRGRLRVYQLTGSQPTSSYWDGENDDYIVSAGPLQFTFKLGRNGYIFTHPQRRAKIEMTLNGVTYTPSSAPGTVLDDYYGFKITDEQGNQYFFEVSDRNTQMVDDGDATPNTGGSYEYTSKWMLTKIIFINGQQITYDYEYYEYPANYNLYRTVSAREASSGAKPSSASFVTVDQFLTSSNILKAIHYPNNVTATFTFDQTTPANGQCAKSIKELSINSDGQCLRYRFNKSYLLSDWVASNDLESPFDQSCNYAGISDRRMILKGIDILSCDGSTVEPYYSFEYSPVKLPPRLSGKRDYFGYNNGASGAGVLGGLPLHTHAFNSSDIYGENRENATDEAIVSAGNLYKINNAYGGSVTFQYELHSGLTNAMSGLPTGDNKFLGVNANDGLRLKAITESDKFHPGHTRTTQYFYSGGQRFLAGGYYAYPSHLTSGTIDEYTVLNSWVSPHQLINGSNHGYSQVTVEVRDATTALLSKTVYNYTNFLDNGQLRYQLNGSVNATNNKQYYQLPFTDKQYIRDWEMGLPTKITQYDQNNRMVSRTTNHYKSIIDLTSSAGLDKNIKIMRAAPPPNLSVNILTLPLLATDTTLPYTGIALLDTTLTEKFISDNAAVTDTVTFVYDNRNNNTITRTRNSRGQYIFSRNVYNYEVSGTAVNGGADWGTTLFRMTDAGIEKVVSTERWKEVPGSMPYTNVLLDASITGYKYENGKIWLNQLQSLESLNPMGYTAYTGSTATTPINPYGKIRAVYNTAAPIANLKQATEVQSYDSKGNPLETKLLDEEVYKAMLWDTISGRKLAEVSNARYADIGCTSFENTIYGVSYTGNENIVNGNFYYKQFGVSTEDSVTGSYCYKLSSAGQASTVSTAPLTIGKEYLITFWAKNGAPTLSGAGLSSITLTGGYTSQGWTFYQARFTPTQATAVNFTTTSLIKLDDLRLMPWGSTMSSWTYDPLFGLKTATDVTGRVARYQYDPLGRQNIVRDQDGNIISLTEYHVSQ